MGRKAGRKSGGLERISEILASRVHAEAPGVAEGVRECEGMRVRGWGVGGRGKRGVRNSERGARAGQVGIIKDEGAESGKPG